MCVPRTFFSFEFSSPSPGQTQALCLAYEIWQLYSPRLDDCRLVFFLKFTEAPGNKLTGSRMIPKGYFPLESCEGLTLSSLIRNKFQIVSIKGPLKILYLRRSIFRIWHPYQMPSRSQRKESPGEPCCFFHPGKIGQTWLAINICTSTTLLKLIKPPAS